MTKEKPPNPLVAGRTGGETSSGNAQCQNSTSFAPVPQESDQDGRRPIGDLFPGIVFQSGIRSINGHIARGDIGEARKLVEAMGLTWDTLFNRRAA